MELPKGKGQINLNAEEDEMIVYLICKDALFIESIESEFGKLKAVYADWKADKLMYDFVDGDAKYSNLTEIINKLKDLDYLKEYTH